MIKNSGVERVKSSDIYCRTFSFFYSDIQQKHLNTSRWLQDMKEQNRNADTSDKLYQTCIFPSVWKEKQYFGNHSVESLTAHFILFIQLLNCSFNKQWWCGGENVHQKQDYLHVFVYATPPVTKDELRCFPSAGMILSWYFSTSLIIK